MGVQLDDAELERFLAVGHTLILGTSRRSGEPFLTPLWYVYHEGALWVRTPARSAKVEHVRRDPRVCCLLEEGERWVDLKAAVLSCDAEIVEDETLCATIDELFREKYANFGPNMKATPKATKRHYSVLTTTLKLVPRPGDVRSWYNQKIRGVERAE